MATNEAEVTWKDLLEEFNRSPSQTNPEIFQKLLLTFEPTPRDLEKYPWLDGLGSVMKEGRGPLLIFFCDVYNRYRAAWQMLYMIDEGYAEIAKQTENQDPNLTDFITKTKADLEKFKKHVSVQLFGYCTCLNLVSDSEIGKELGMGGVLCNEAVPPAPSSNL